MTRNALIIFVLFFVTSNFATAESPVVQGLGGAGRAGLPKEALFSNPAAAASLKDSSLFLTYEKPRIPEFNAGGRAYSAGIYDGTGQWKGGLGYIRSAQAIVENGQQAYEDRNEVRFAVARPVTESVAMGGQARYIKKSNGGAKSKFFQGDLGLLFPFVGGMQAGLTYENILKRENEGERPGTLAAAVRYPIGSGLEILGDGTRQMRSTRSGAKGWALGALVHLTSDFVFRTGRFQDVYRRVKGWSVGLGWAGPRASFDYAMTTTGQKPHERDHILGMNVAF